MMSRIAPRLAPRPAHRLAPRLAAGLALALAAGTHAQTIVTVANGRLSLTTPGNDQVVKVEVGSTGLLRVFGFPGLADGTSYAGITAVNVTTGAGRDFVEFDVQSAQSLDVRVDTGTGDSETKVQWKILPGTGEPLASMQLVSGAGATKLAVIDVDSETSRARVNIDTGAANDVQAKIISDEPSGFLGVAFNATARKTAFELLSGASALDVSLRGTHASPGNEVKYGIAQIRPGAVSVAANVGLGSANDLLEAKIAAPGSQVTLTGDIRGAQGNDQVLVESEAFSTVTGLTLRGGDGADYLSIDVKGRFQLSQTLGARILAGPGNDALILRTDTAIVGTGLPNDVIPVIDGGLGFDLYQAFGQILNCEGRL